MTSYNFEAVIILQYDLQYVMKWMKAYKSKEKEIKI